MGIEGRDLAQQQRRQLAPGAHGHARNVVDGFVAVKLHALAARVGQGVDHMGRDALQPELEDLEQAHRPRTDDDGIGFLRRGAARGDHLIRSLTLPGLPFHSSASGSAGLRLVMLFQPSA